MHISMFFRMLGADNTLQSNSIKLIFQTATTRLLFSKCTFCGDSQGIKKQHTEAIQWSLRRLFQTFCLWINFYTDGFNFKQVQDPMSSRKVLLLQWQLPAPTRWIYWEGRSNLNMTMVSQKTISHASLKAPGSLFHLHLPLHVQYERARTMCAKVTGPCGCSATCEEVHLTQPGIFVGWRCGIKWTWK